MRVRSVNKSIAARTSFKRYVRHNLGFKAPRGWGWLTNPKKAAYNRAYYRKRKAEDALVAALVTIVFVIGFYLLKLTLEISIAIITGFFRLCKVGYQKYKDRRQVASIEVQEARISSDHLNLEMRLQSVRSDVPIRIRVKYRDVKGDTTLRDIDVMSVSESSNSDLVILAFCNMRNRTRSFRVDRIQECTNLETGEIIEDVARYFREIWSLSEIKKDLA